MKQKFGILLGTVTTLFTALASISHWRLALLVHLRWHFVLVLLGAVFLVGWRKPRGWMLLFLAGLVLNLWHVRPFVQSRPAPSNKLPQLSVLHLNADKGAADPWLYVNTQKPDIVFIQELTPDVVLPPSGYRVQVAEPQWNTRGIGMLVCDACDLAVVSAEIITLPSVPERPFVHAVVERGGQQFNLLSWHVIRPKFNEWIIHAYNNEYVALAEWVATQPAELPLLIIGDFNGTPWSPNFVELLDSAELHNSNTTPIPQPTWPGALAWPFGLPIDHAIHNSSAAIVSRTVGPHVGSDHRPLAVVVTADR